MGTITFETKKKQARIITDDKSIENILTDSFKKYYKKEGFVYIEAEKKRKGGCK